MATVAVARPWERSSGRRWRAAPPLPHRPTAAESRWLDRLASWVAFVDDAREDPRQDAVSSCDERLDRIGEPPRRLTAQRELAADACSSFARGAHDALQAEVSLDARLVGRADAETAEGTRLLALLRRDLPGAGARGGGRVVALYGRVASRLARRPVSVRCFSSEEHWSTVLAGSQRTEPGLSHVLGFAVIHEDRVDLSPSACGGLERVRTKRASLSATALWVGVLAHESQHMLGVDGIENEAKTECYGLQKLDAAARLLGVAPARAALLPQLHLRVVYRSLPQEYRSPECRDGGRYDLRLHRGAFP